MILKTNKLNFNYVFFGSDMASYSPSEVFFFYLVSRRPTPQSMFDLNVLGSTTRKVHGLPTPHKLYDAQLWFFGVSLRHWSYSARSYVRRVP